MYNEQTKAVEEKKKARIKKIFQTKINVEPKSFNVIIRV